MYRLVDTQTHAIVAEYVEPTGLVRSYEFDASDPLRNSAFANRTFAYDQALALLAGIGTNDEAFARSTVDGLLQLQETSGQWAGAFVFAAPQLTPEFRTPLIRTGAHAIATDALLAYVQKYPGAPNAQLVTQRAKQAIDYIESVRSSSGPTEGLYLGGFGDYNGPQGDFRPNVQITWASTEHNTDIWHVFTRAAKVFPAQKSEYIEKARQVHEALQTRIYNTDEQRYNQGVTPSGPDTSNPLDVNSWGAIQMYGASEDDKAAVALEQLPLFKFTRSGITGYAPFYDSPGYPGAVENVWYEGSFGVALAYLRTGEYDAYRTLLNNLSAGQEANGSFVYATDPDVTYEITNRKSVASTAWYVLASEGRDALWNNCIYVAPQVDPATPAQPVPQTSPQVTRQQTHRVQLRGGDISQDTADITAALEAQQQAPLSQVAPQFSQESNSSRAEPSRTDKPTQKTNWWAIGVMVTVAITLLIGTVATLLRRHDR